METVTRADRVIIQRQHSAIYEAIQQRDPEGAQEAMRLHMIQHEKDLKNALLTMTGSP